VSIKVSLYLVVLTLFSADSTSGYGQQIAVAILRNGAKCKSSAEILGLLFEELRCLPDVDRGMHLDLAVGVFVFSTEVGELFLLVWLHWSN